MHRIPKPLGQWFPTDFGPYPALGFLKFWSLPRYNIQFLIDFVSKQAPRKYRMPHQNIRIRDDCSRHKITLDELTCH